MRTRKGLGMGAGNISLGRWKRSLISPIVNLLLIAFLFAMFYRDWVFLAILINLPPSVHVLRIYAVDIKPITVPYCVLVSYLFIPNTF